MPEMPDDTKGCEIINFMVCYHVWLCPRPDASQNYAASQLPARNRFATLLIDVCQGNWRKNFVAISLISFGTNINANKLEKVQKLQRK